MVADAPEVKRQHAEMLAALQNVVRQAEANPFLSVGMLVEHHSNIRALVARYSNPRPGTPAAIALADQMDREMAHEQAARRSLRKQGVDEPTAEEIAAEDVGTPRVE